MARTQPRRTRAPGAYLALPLWGRYLLASAIAVVLLVLMIMFVSQHNTNSPTETNPAGERRANHEAELLTAQDQAPRTAVYPAGLSAQAGVDYVIHARMAERVSFGAISGPLERAACRATGIRIGSSVGFNCRILAGNVYYPFLASADTRTRRVTYCKHDPPPSPSDYVPVSSRCTA
jgi:hypothetical protein